MAVYQKPKKRSALDDLATIFGIALPAVQMVMGHKQAGLGREADAAEAAAGRAHDLKLQEGLLAGQRASDESADWRMLKREGYEFDEKQGRQYRPAQRPEAPAFTGEASDAGLAARSAMQPRISEYIPDYSRLTPRAQDMEGAWNKPEAPDPMEVWLRERQAEIDNPLPMTPFQEAQIRNMDAQTAMYGREDVGGAGDGGELGSFDIKTANDVISARYPWWGVDPDKFDQSRISPDEREMAIGEYLAMRTGTEPELSADEIAATIPALVDAYERGETAAIVEVETAKVDDPLLYRLVEEEREKRKREVYAQPTNLPFAPMSGPVNPWERNR